MSTGNPKGLRTRGLLAGEIAKELGIGVQTLHFYERRALIPPPPRSESGYRLYGSEVVERIRFIRKAQALGLSLDEIQEILALSARGASPCGQVQETLAGKPREVDERLAELKAFRDELATLVRDGSRRAELNSAQVCPIVEDAPALSAPKRASVVSQK